MNVYALGYFSPTQSTNAARNLAMPMTTWWAGFKNSWDIVVSLSL